jgi:hypothetical protein
MNKHFPFQIITYKTRQTSEEKLTFFFKSAECVKENGESYKWERETFRVLLINR